MHDLLGDISKRYTLVYEVKEFQDIQFPLIILILVLRFSYITQNQL